MSFEGGRLPSAHVAVEDRQAAQHLVDSWVERFENLLTSGGVSPEEWGRMALELRGMVAALAADCREAGYLEGQQAGRRQVAGWVRDCLAGEGL